MSEIERLKAALIGAYVEYDTQPYQMATDEIARLERVPGFLYQLDTEAVEAIARGDGKLPELPPDYGVMSEGDKKMSDASEKIEQKVINVVNEATMAAGLSEKGGTEVAVDALENALLCYRMRLEELEEEEADEACDDDDDEGE